MSVERQAIAGLKWAGAAKFAGQLVSWVTTLVVLRLLQPKDYGLMAIVTSLIALLSNIAELGLGASIVHAKNIARQDLERVNGAVILINVLMGIVVALCAPLIAKFFGNQQLVLLVQVASLHFVLSGLSTVPQSLAYRDMNFRWLAWVELATVVITGGLTLGLAYFGFGVWALLLSSLLSMVVRTAMLLKRDWVRPRLEFTGLLKHLSFGGTVTSSRLVWQLVYQSDMFVAGRVLTPAAVGFYSVSLHVATLPMQKIMGVINQVAFPAAARLQGEPERLRTRLLEATRILALFAIPVLWGMSSVAREFVLIVMGDQWDPAIVPLQLICLVVPLRMLTAVYATAMTAIGLAIVDLRNAVTNVLVLPACFYFGAQHGVNGLAAAWIVAIPIVFGINFPRIAGSMGISLLDIVKVVWSALIAGAAMYGAVTAVRALLPGLHSWLALMLHIAVGGLVYVAAVTALDRRTVPEIKRVLKAFRG
jgi:O-antigen/teichoic acid export membrane protein